MPARPIAFWITVASLSLAMWSVGWGHAVRPHHKKPHRRPVEAAPAPGGVGLGRPPDSSATGKKARSALESEPESNEPHPKGGRPEGRRGETVGEARRPESRDGRRGQTHTAGVSRGLSGDRRARLPAPGERSSCSVPPASRSAVVRPNANRLPSRPNIVVLLLDDQDDYTPYWEAMPQTSAMVKNGVRFRNAFSPTPICAPGRCTFLTGRLAHNTGVYTLSGPHGPSAFGGEASTEFSVSLGQLGYVNGYFGKTWGG